ncbi:hypothetical protein [Streptomyces angustmyceticus]|uniref:hypothetical protein n=1 Tax=Streptomyces angustmyceticus TaxID=285578 RepID=UPI00380E742A
MGKGEDRYMFSYEPLGEPEADSGARDAEEQAAAGFLAKVSDLAFKGGPLGIELTRLDIAGRTFAFREVREADSRTLASSAGAVPTDDTERGEMCWMPEPGSPAWAHLAWLVRELPFLHTFREYGPEGGPELRGVEAPSREWADVLVEHRGQQWRVRVTLEGRTEPIEFPGMVIGELFGEGGHRKLLVEGEPGLVDAGI